MEDLIERVKQAPVVADFNGVVLKYNFYWMMAILNLHNPLLWRRIGKAFVKRTYEINEEKLWKIINFFWKDEHGKYNKFKDEKKILKGKISVLKGISYTKVTEVLEKDSILKIFSMGINPDFRYLIEKLKGVLGPFNLPIITREGKKETEYWFNLERESLEEKSHLRYLTSQGINPIIIANELKKENGFYKGEIFPSNEGERLMPSNPLITGNKIDFYSLGDRKKIAIVDKEEYNLIMKYGKPENLYIININKRKTLDKQVGGAITFLS